EAPAADHVAVDVPSDPLRHLHATGVALRVEGNGAQVLLGHVHVSVSFGLGACRSVRHEPKSPSARYSPDFRCETLCCRFVRRTRRWRRREARGYTRPTKSGETGAVTDTARVLVVDDDPTIREMLTEYLASHGYEVSVSQDGASMRAEIERALPDVILLDVQMPGEDGLTLARYLRERYDVGIIMVTGATDPVDRVIGLEVGADDYIGKPFDPRELRARVKSVLRRL